MYARMQINRLDSIHRAYKRGIYGQDWDSAPHVYNREMCKS